MTKYLIFFCLVIVSQLGLSQEIRIKGEVEFSFNYSNIKAGEDYELETSSQRDGATLSIKKLKKNSYWSVTVYKSDINWNRSVKVYVRRTNNGSGSGSTWGGSNYRQIRNIPLTFLQGSGTLSNIYLQYKLSGISVNLPSNTYYTDIVYTLYEQ